ncbi:MAG: hypothetical protein U1E65_01750 [Myxococcota bacterium]
MSRSNFLLVPLLAFELSCVPGTTTPGDSADSVSGVIAYEGEARGPLRVAAFSSFPPVGPPIAEIAIEEPRFPQAYEIRGLPPGRYFVLAMIDSDPEDGDRYRPRVDPGGCYGDYKNPASISTNTAQPTRNVDVHLLPPHGGSPWDR